MDGSTEFKCDRRRSASFPDTAEITSSTYRFQKKGLTGEMAKALCSTSSITMLAKNSCKFADFIRDKTFDACEELVSFDVVSLFTKIPVDLAVKVA